VLGNYSAEEGGHHCWNVNDTLFKRMSGAFFDSEVALQQAGATFRGPAARTAHSRYGAQFRDDRPPGTVKRRSNALRLD
jgi:hypothetical protein